MRDILLGGWTLNSWLRFEVLVCPTKSKTTYLREHTGLGEKLHFGFALDLRVYGKDGPRLNSCHGAAFCAFFQNPCNISEIQLNYLSVTVLFWLRLSLQTSICIMYSSLGTKRYTVVYLCLYIHDTFHSCCHRITLSSWIKRSMCRILFGQLPIAGLFFTVRPA